MLFFAAEELSPGHPNEVELDAFIELACDVHSALAKENIALSLNPWSTLYHSARGRTLRDGQQFRLMVGENGRESKISPCPLCERWQNYLADSFAKMAKMIRPTTLWIEDDWRLRNHDSALGWGGCFCSEHLRLFSDLVGEKVEREALMQNLLHPGPPHPWREAWLSLSKTSMVQPLEFVTNAIRTASLTTEVALMSGSPDMHAAEGRNWAAMQRAVAGNSTFISRPTMKPYTQTHALGTPPGLTRLTIANLHGEIDIFPELENSPRSGAYSKSRSYSIWQILHCAVMGSSGITINHYDMLGTGISLDPDFGTGLAEIKPIVNALASLQIDDRKAMGASVLFNPNISRVIQTSNPGRGMLGLSQNSTIWGDVCSILGVAFNFSKEISSGPTLVNQQTLRAFSDEEVEKLLHGAVILDADSVAILLERGFAKELGISQMVRRSLEETAYSYEQIEAERFWQPGGIEKPRMTMQRCSQWLMEYTTDPRTEILTTICGADRQTLFPGATLFKNEKGGRVVSLAYPINETAQFFMAFFNAYRRVFLQRLLMELGSSAGMAFVEDNPMNVYRAPTARGTLLAAINPTDDAVREVKWAIPATDFTTGSWTILADDGSWSPASPLRQSHGSHDTLTFITPVRPLSGAFFHHQ